MMLPKFPDPSKFLSSEWGPVKCFCPTNSSRLCGRTLSARGMLIFAVTSNARLLVWLPDTGYVIAKEETLSFRFFLDGPSETISGEIVDM